MENENMVTEEQNEVTIDKNKYVVINAPEASKIVLASPSNYEELENKPSINSVELIGNVGLSELGIRNVPEDGTQGQILTKTSDSYEWADAPSGGSDWVLHSTSNFNYEKLVLVSDLPSSYNKLKFEVTGRLEGSGAYIGDGVGVVDFYYYIKTAYQDEYSNGLYFEPDYELSTQQRNDIILELELSKMQAYSRFGECLDAYCGDVMVCFASANTSLDYGKGNFLCSMQPNNSQLFSFNNIVDGTLNIYYK